MGITRRMIRKRLDLLHARAPVAGPLVFIKPTADTEVPPTALLVLGPIGAFPDGPFYIKSKEKEQSE